MTKKEKAQAELLARHLRSLEVGKAGYKDADAALDEYIQAGGPIDHPLTLRTGETATVVDQFANRNRVSSGLSVRRYQVEVERARAITGKL